MEPVTQATITGIEEDIAGLLDIAFSNEKRNLTEEEMFQYKASLIGVDLVLGVWSTLHQMNETLTDISAALHSLAQSAAPPGPNNPRVY